MLFINLKNLSYFIYLTKFLGSFYLNWFNQNWLHFHLYFVKLKKNFNFNFLVRKNFYFQCLNLILLILFLLAILNFKKTIYLIFFHYLYYFNYLIHLILQVLLTLTHILLILIIQFIKLALLKNLPFFYSIIINFKQDPQVSFIYTLFLII